MTFEGTGDVVDLASPEVEQAFADLAHLEKDFAAVELDTMRQKEYSMQDLYAKRSTILRSIPNFWPTVFMNGPEEFTNVLSTNDAEILESITNLKVERYQIKNGSEGEPRSLRFTFEFAKNNLFENSTVTKEFEFVPDIAGGPSDGGFISRPVNFKWTKSGKKSGLNKTLDLAEQLYQAEQALVAENKKVAIEQEEREGLWQYEKLREELEKQEESEEPIETSFLDFFGYRGAIAGPSAKVAKKQRNDHSHANCTEAGHNHDEEDSDDDDEDDGLLDVEIFPIGEEVAIAIAEDIWPDAMDYFMKAHAEDDSIEDFDGIDSDEDEDQDAPELVEFGGFDGEDADEEQEKPAKKKQRRS